MDILRAELPHVHLMYSLITHQKRASICLRDGIKKGYKYSACRWHQFFFRHHRLWKLDSSKIVIRLLIRQVFERWFSKAYPPSIYKPMSIYLRVDNTLEWALGITLMARLSQQCKLPLVVHSLANIKKVLKEEFLAYLKTNSRYHGNHVSFSP